MPRNRGDIWKLVVFNNLMYIHTEDSLFKTKGKQTLQLQDGLEAFVGGGDIFQQAPDELLQTEAGYGGTVSQWVSLVCPHGYFCMDYRNRKVLLVKDKIYDIGKSGLENWFRDNIPYALVEYGLPDDFDNPIQGIGFHATWDEQFDRILLTKRDLKPTQTFIDAYNNSEIVWDSIGNKFDDKSNLNYLCAAGVCFVFLVALNKKLREKKWFEKNSGDIPDNSEDYFISEFVDSFSIVKLVFFCEEIFNLYNFL